MMAQKGQSGSEKARAGVPSALFVSVSGTGAGGFIGNLKVDKNRNGKSNLIGSARSWCIQQVRYVCDIRCIRSELNRTGEMKDNGT